MKKLHLNWLRGGGTLRRVGLVLVLCLTTVGQMWAYTLNWPTLYFDDMSSTTAPTTWEQAMFFYFIDYNGSGRGSMGRNMERITNTNLYYVQEGENRGTNMSGFSYGFIATKDWGWEGEDNWSSRWTYACNNYSHSGSSQTNLPYGSYLCTSTGGSNLTVTKLNDGNDGSSDLKYDQTVNVVVNGSTPSTSPAAISLASAYWKDKKTVTTSTTSNITKGGSTKSDTYSNAAYTATTTLTTGTPNSGYYFVGWYDGDTRKSTSTSYTYYPRAATTITARYETRYTVTVSSGDHGRITTGASVTAGYYTNPTITAEAYGTNSNQYRFLKWTCTGGASVADENSATTTVSATSAGTVTANFVSVWTIKGGDTGATDNDGDEMGDWKVYNSLDYTGTSYKYRLTVDLPAKTSYRFKIYDYNNSTWYGCGTRAHDYTFAGQTDEVTFNTSPGNNIMLLTGEAGTYTFDWNSSTKKLKITYPTTPVKHPSMNYVYMEKYSDWNSGSHCYIHYWKTGTPDVPLTTWGTDDPKITAYNNFSDKSKNFYIFPALTEYPNFRAKNELGDASGNHDTGNQTVTGHQGHYIYHNGSAWVWGTFNVTINLNRQETVTSDGTTSRTVAFNDAVLSDITCPTWTGYIFGGYYNTNTCDDKQIIDKDGHWLASKAGYTDASKHWIKDGAENTLYAKWTEDTHTVTVAYKYGGTSIASNGSVSNVGIATSQSITAPDIAGYVFTGWSAMPSGVTKASGELSDKTISINATADSKVITANYTVKYALYGSLEPNDDAGNGMPGWSVADNFTYNSGSSNYTLVLSLTKPNNTYKFRILDHNGNISYGLAEKAVVPAGEATAINSTADDAQLATAGRGSYTLTVVEDGGYPKLTITNQASVYVATGIRTETVDGAVEEAVGGTITVSDAASDGNTYTNGQYIADGEHVYITATPNEGYRFVGWWGSSAYSGDATWETTSVDWTIDGANVNAYAKFVEDANVFNASASNNWSNTSNWSKGELPTLNQVVRITKPVIVNVNDAEAKRVIIYNNGSTMTGKLTVDAGQKLTVATTIKKTTDGSTYVATTENDLVFNSDGTYGVGALVWGEANTSPGEATVNFYSKSGGSKVNPTAAINQFIGTPFTSETSNWLYNYYNSWVLGVDYTSTPTFYLLNNETMDPFKGYCVIYNGSAGHTYNMSGTLVTNTNQSNISLQYKTGTGSNSDNENLLANSWSAPIRIAAFQSSDFVKADQTIYIFNSGSQDDQTSGEETKGQYTSIPINDAGNNAIPSMQSFSVYSNASGGSAISLDYTKLVYNPSVSNKLSLGPNKAPQILNESLERLRVKVLGEKGFGDIVRMIVREDFTTGFDNGWDGRKIFGESFAPQLYTVSEDGNMAVAAEPTFEGTILGFKAGTEDETYTFSFEYDADQTPLYLYDMDTQAYTRVLSDNTYIFSTTDKDVHNRFILTYNMPQAPTGIETVDGKANGAVKFLENDKLFIFRSGRLYNAEGALVK